MNAPKCPVHVCVGMELKEGRQPIWISLGDGLTGIALRKAKRKFWKCPAPGCPRVELYSPSDKEEREARVRECTRCGIPHEVTGMRRAISRYVCAECEREERKIRRDYLERLRKRTVNALAVVVRGHAEKERA